MEPEETSSAEIPEKVGLKRKLTGPPRLLLGKTKSPEQDKKKSDAQALRKQRRDKNNDVVEEHQGDNEAGCESHDVESRSPQPAFTAEEGETHKDLREEPLEALSRSQPSQAKERHGKSRLKRSRAKATIRRLFLPALMCFRRRKQLHHASEDGEDQNCVEEPPTLPGDSLVAAERCKADFIKTDGTRKGKRKFRVRMWPIFKRLAVTSSNNQKEGKDSAGQDNSTFFEITSEKSLEKSNSAADQSDYCAPEPSGDKTMDEQMKGSSEIHEDMVRILEESCPGEYLEHKEEGKETVTLSVEVNVDLNNLEKVEQGRSRDQDACGYLHSNVKNEEDTKMQISELSEPDGLLDSAGPPVCINECDLDTSVDGISPCISNVVVINDLDKIVAIENEVKCKPVITIEDVHSSDEEDHEPVENDTQQPNTLSPLVSMNGSCCPFTVKRMAKDTLQILDHSTSNSPCSEILLMQTALSLVHAAISGAMEQLSAELQSNQIDRDHA